MDWFPGVWRAHPVGFTLYLGVAGYMAVRLAGMLRDLWRHSRSAKDRQAAVFMGAILGVAFCVLWGFLYMSLFR